MRMKHITIMTAKLEESIEFYEKVVGLELRRDMREKGRALVFLADPEDSVCVELIENTEAPCRCSGISIGFRAEDVEAKHAELKAAGLEPTEIVSPGPMVRFFFVKDPNGVEVQFI